MKYLLGLLLFFSLTGGANAAVVAFTEFDAFDNSVSSVISVSFETAEGFTVGETINSSRPIGDFTINERGNDPLFQLEVRDNFATFDGTQYIGLSTATTGNQLTDFEVVDFAFDNARSGVGLFVQFDSFNPFNDATIELSANGASVSANRFSTPVGLTLDNDDVYFLGLADDAGDNVISSATLQVSGGGNIRYTFDRFVSGMSVTAVPEPSGAALLLLSMGLVARRRPR